VTGELVTAALLNTHLRDNLTELREVGGYDIAVFTSSERADRYLQAAGETVKKAAAKATA
jgi:uroporphyrinogen-III synthase